MTIETRQSFDERVWEAAKKLRWHYKLRGGNWDRLLRMKALKAKVSKSELARCAKYQEEWYADKEEREQSVQQEFPLDSSAEITSTPDAPDVVEAPSAEELGPEEARSYLRCSRARFSGFVDLELFSRRKEGRFIYYSKEDLSLWNSLTDEEKLVRIQEATKPRRKSRPVLTTLSPEGKAFVTLSEICNVTGIPEGLLRGKAYETAKESPQASLEGWQGTGTMLGQDGVACLADLIAAYTGESGMADEIINTLVEAKTKSETAPSGSVATPPMLNITQPERKHRRVQLVMKKSEVEAGHRLCREQGISFNELMNQLLRRFIDNQGFVSAAPVPLPVPALAVAEQQGKPKRGLLAWIRSVLGSDQ